MRLLAVFSLCGFSLLAFGDETIVDEKVDNEAVYITQIVEAQQASHTIPGHATNRVLISIGAADIQTTYPDGRKSRAHWRAGQARWIPAGESYVSRNVGPTSARFIEIELKRPAPSSAIRRQAELDPVVIDPKHNLLLLENDQVRVFRSWREPGATEKMHQHTGTGRAAVLLTDLNATVKVANGSTSGLHASAGDVLWSGTVTHATTNLDSKKFEMVVVEVK